MSNFFDKLFFSEKKHLAQCDKKALQVEAIATNMEALSDVELSLKTSEFQKRLEEGATLDEIQIEAYATVREAARRVLKEYPYHVQIVGAMILNEGDIAEMKTGEGKTLTAILPVYLNALTKKGVHVVTVNEYLARRDAAWMGEIYRFLGLSVGVNTRDLSNQQKKAMFACDITYTTNSELGFDYLRDNMVTSQEDRVLRGLNYAIIDEVDSILIDESRTPLIISGAGELLDNFYIQADLFAKSLKLNADYELLVKDHQIQLTQQGIAKAERYFKVDHLYTDGQASLVHYIQNALKANYIMILDVEYVVQEDEIIIVDQFTGRKMEGREFSDGLHQSIQAKEGVGIKQETKTLATITFQNFFRLYDKLAGMTGTAKTEEAEFLTTYNMRIFQIPTNRDVIRIDYPDEIFKSKEEKYNALLEEVVNLNQKGQPVLVGTLSVENSEVLSKMFTKRKIIHEVLNAKNDAKEAQIIANAGVRKAVTIATNMAGRGTDIKLGEGVMELGGLVVLGSERHDAKRIDNQLRGRSGRQGDPGYSRFYVSMQDDLIIRYQSEYIEESTKAFKQDQISKEKIARIVDQIQKRAEDLHYETRKNVLEYDDILMAQRKVIYQQRDEILMQDEVHDVILELFKNVSNDHVEAYLNSSKLEQLQDQFILALTEFGLSEDSLRNDMMKQADKKGMKEWLSTNLIRNYQLKIESVQEEIKNFEKVVLLKIMDRQWIEHVDAMSRLKEGIYLRSYAQEKPLDAYKVEAYERFENMIKNIAEEMVTTCCKLQIQMK